MNEYRIIYSGVFYQENLIHHLIPGERIYSKEAQVEIDRNWDKINKNTDLDLFNGRVYSLLKSELIDGNIHYYIQETDYKSFCGTNMNGNFHGTKADILAICSIIETSDEFVILGKRSNNVAECRNIWHVFGGNLDEVISGKEPAFLAIKKEIQEELGINENEITSIKCLGLGLNLKIKKHEFLFLTKTSLSSKCIQDCYLNAADMNEHQYLKFIHKSELSAFVKNNDFAIIGKAAVHQYITNLLSLNYRMQ